MAFIKEIVIAVLFTAIALAQLPNIDVPAGLPVNQSMPSVPENPAGNNTQIPAIPENPVGNNTAIPAIPENPAGNNTAIPALPATNGTMPEATVPPVGATPSAPGQEGVQSTEPPSRLMNAINGIRGNRG